MERCPETKARPGFTLIELLVVISIIALLIGILLPALGAARNTAKLAACLSNSRQMSVAINAYLVDNRNVTPAATYNNASGNSPKGRGAAPGTVTGTGVGGVVWDSIGGALEYYLSGNAEEVYRCPAAPGAEDDGWDYGGEDPLSGFAADDVFKPNYFFMSTSTWISLNNSSWYPQLWAVRNVANVQADSLASLSETVAFVDESTSQHTDSQDIYTRTADEVDLDNFAYLDGHAATQRFDNLRGYFAALHGGIPQTQWGISFTEHSNWAQRDDLPPE